MATGEDKNFQLKKMRERMFRRDRKTEQPNFSRKNVCGFKCTPTYICNVRVIHSSFYNKV